ncbi:hypothetical protein BJ508DRAFT_331406 [Ascobolus immersus RN42]|uniref:Uncharacterized protein n=1 Tax=Ascobolus immersus RN42 TaxID=1160509 RepID=A0A3N4HQL1_ASCIM|nr:hypothetical protein BJ508DRAFT_331406 [Ascobolus immersus RN42]
MVRPWINQTSGDYNKVHLVRQLHIMKSIKKIVIKSSGATDYKDKSQIASRKEVIDMMVREMVKDKVFTASKEPRVRCRGQDNSLLEESKDLWALGMLALCKGDPLDKYFKSARCHWSGDAALFWEQEDEEGAWV